MKKWQEALLWLGLTVILGVTVGFAIRACRMTYFKQLNATVLEEHSKTVGQVDRIFGPPIPVIETTLVVSYSVNGNQYTGEIRTGRSGPFAKGTKVSFICNKRDPGFIDLNE